MTYKVLVSDKLSEDGLEVFRKAGFQVDHTPTITQEEIKASIGEYDAWVVRSRSRATPEILEHAANLKVIGRAGVGIDNVDLHSASKRGIVVMNTPGGNTISTAEHAISMLMACARLIPAADASMKAGKWDKKAFMGSELNGKTLGIIGLGRIGQEVAKRMVGFGMTILGYDPFVSGERMNQLGVTSASVDEICEKADFITLHSPLTDETRNIINAERLAKMKKGARIVNCARGGLVDEEALAKALTDGPVAGAAFDVFATEPLPVDSPLRSLPNMVLTPHVAASTTEAQEKVAVQVAEQIVDLLQNGKIVNAINAPSIPPEILKRLKPYLDLCEKLGRFAAQFHKAAATNLECRFSGSILEYNTEPLARALAKGFISATTDDTVNEINALSMLRERGISIQDTRLSGSYRFSNLMSLSVTFEDGKIHCVSGTVFEPDHGRIVMVDDKTFAAVPEGNLIVLENDDVPGIIGRVGTYFGEKGVNIAEMTWGRREAHSDAMTIINVDGEVTNEMLEELAAIPNIRWAKSIKL
ncbi:MAG: phosphoglycerate dehydrogenase [Sumerlaeia bacterium]